MDKPAKKNGSALRAPMVAATALALLVGFALFLRENPPRETVPTPPTPAATSDDVLTQPNLVLVVLDTLRRDVTTLPQPPRPQGSVGAYLAKYDTTPHLAALGRRGTVFTHAYSTAPWTVPSHASMFTGLLPSQHGARGQHLRLAPSSGPTLAERLSEKGYDTAAFYSNPWLSDQATGLLRGFHHRSEAPIGPVGKLRSNIGDQGGRHTLQALDAWLTSRDRQAPCFVFINLLEAHLAYDPPATVRHRLGLSLPESAQTTIDWAHRYNAGVEKASDADWSAVRQLYAADVAFSDQLLGELVEILERGGVLKKSVLIVTSDHGENLGEHGLAEHQFSLHESLLAVPLVVVDDTHRIPPGRREDTVTGCDIYATVLECAGVNAPTPPHSRSLLQLSDNDTRTIVAEYTPHPQLVALMRRVAERAGVDTARARSYAHSYRSILQGGLRLTLRDDGASFLHQVEEDPAEEHDLSSRRESDVARLRRALEGYGPASGTGRPALPVDSATAERLRALGYMAK